MLEQMLKEAMAEVERLQENNSPKVVEELRGIHNLIESVIWDLNEIDFKE